ncbi:hypothetical protein [Natronomonas sp. EA1]|uniref:hypothetical protein n=1 Tax=Natronomonas sp. EA1 TaxID=3421655 RepID=UPI003EC14B71
MREVTRNTLVAIGVVVVLLLALGALPSLLKSGDPYYVTAEPVSEAPTETTINASNLSQRAYPYTFGALANAPEGGQSEPYWKGPFGFKEAFSHSPFDEFAAYREQYAGATDGEAVFIRQGNTTFRLTIEQARQ